MMLLFIAAWSAIVFMFGMIAGLLAERWRDPCWSWYLNGKEIKRKTR